IQADVIFATSTPLTVAIPAVVVSGLRGVPYVFEVRDSWPEVPVAMGILRNRALVAMARWLERLAYRRAATVVCLSPGMAETVRDVLKGRPKSIAVIPNAADEDVF